MFAYSSIEHMGLMTFAFGMGGPIANFAGLLHMTVHSLIKSAIFFAVGHAAQKAGTQMMDEIRGLIKVSPTVAWGLMLGSLAILGMPPFGVFASEFLIVTTAMREQPWATPFLLVALGVAFASVFSRVQPMVFGETNAQAAGASAGADPGVRAPGARADAGPVHPALPGHLVPAGGARCWGTEAMADRGLEPRTRAPAGAAADLARQRRRRAVARGRTQRGAGRRPAGVAVGLSTVPAAAQPRWPCRAAYALADGLVWLELPLGDATAGYPDLAGIFPCAARMQRATADLLRHRRPRARDDRAALAGPRRSGPTAASRCASDARHRQSPRRARCPRDYPFVRVEGDGVHEIAVGPVHAGIIEPGHFRFSVVGEKVLRLEQRLGYTHKGIERRFTELAPLEAHRLAGRVSGDSTVAFAWAYCMALESAAGCAVPRARAVAARAAARARAGGQPPGRPGRAGQRRRAGLRAGAVLAPARRLAAPVERGVRPPLDDGLRRARRRGGRPGRRPWRDRAAAAVRRDRGARCARWRRSTTSTPGCRTASPPPARVTPELAAQLGLTGLAGRASGQGADLRCDHALAALRPPGVSRWPRQRNGDVAARVAVRFDEMFESLRLIREICAAAARRRGARGRRRCRGRRPSAPAGSKAGAARCSWRWNWAPTARIRRCHCHDPSWQNWPVLEHAVIGNIVPDFPLINKSFNLSYSGHDL